MLYNSKHEQATVLDIVRHLTYYHFYNQEKDFIERDYDEDEIYNKANLALYEKQNDTFVEVVYYKNNTRHEANALQKCELELIELVRNIDVSVYKNTLSEQDSESESENEDFLNTDYEKMYDEDTTDVFFKCFVVAIAQLIQQKLNMSFNDALIKCTKFDIYDSYMQAETVDEIVEYAIKYKLNR